MGREGARARGRCRRAPRWPPIRVLRWAFRGSPLHATPTASRARDSLAASPPRPTSRFTMAPASAPPLASRARLKVPYRRAPLGCAERSSNDTRRGRRFLGIRRGFSEVERAGARRAHGGARLFRGGDGRSSESTGPGGGGAGRRSPGAHARRSDGRPRRRAAPELDWHSLRGGRREAVRGRRGGGRQAGPLSSEPRGRAVRPVQGGARGRRRTGGSRWSRSRSGSLPAGRAGHGAGGSRAGRGRAHGRTDDAR